MRAELGTSPEDLGYWYFRLNGFLAIPNFIVHPDEGSSQRTDVDIIGIRFPHRQEIVHHEPLEDHSVVVDRTRALLVLAEIKTRQCSLNGPWTRPKDENLRRVLDAVGAFDADTGARVADSLYEKGTWSDRRFTVSLLCLGASHNSGLARRYPDVPQVLWHDVLGFIYQRFKRYRLEKCRHDQWPESGKRLWDYFDQAVDFDDFVKSMALTLE